MGYPPWGHKELDLTELLSMCTHTAWSRSLDAERQGRFLECSPLGRQGCDLGCVNTAVPSTPGGESGLRW